MATDGAETRSQWPLVGDAEWALDRDDTAQAWRLWHGRSGELTEQGRWPGAIPADDLMQVIAHYTGFEAADHLVAAFR